MTYDINKLLDGELRLIRGAISEIIDECYEKTMRTLFYKGGDVVKGEGMVFLEVVENTTKRKKLINMAHLVSVDEGKNVTTFRTVKGNIDVEIGYEDACKGVGMLLRGGGNGSSGKTDDAEGTDAL